MTKKEVDLIEELIYLIIENYHIQKGLRDAGIFLDDEPSRPTEEEIEILKKKLIN